MGLADLAVFVETAQSARTELLAYNVNLFNAATNGAIVLRSAAHSGDYSEAAMYADVADLVISRNVYDDTTDIAHKKLAQIVDRSVKVAAGTPPVDIAPGWMDWIQKNPSEQGTVLGAQLAAKTLAHMVNSAIQASTAAIANDGTNVYDGTGVGAGTAAFNSFIFGAAKLGDRSSDIACWLLHSKPMHDLYAAAVANANVLFNFGTVNVREDGFGRRFVMTDAPAMVVAGNPLNYYSVGLVPGGVVVEENNDYRAITQEIAGKPNIQNVFQAQWSYNLGVKGFAWDKTHGGPSPTAAAVAVGTNWDKFATDAKDLAGVIVKTK